MDTMNLFYAGL